jgi:hypothetical protein
MNATTALAMAFLQGRVLTIKNAFNDFGVTNLGREVGRAIERKFGVTVAKVKKTGKSRYGIDCWWYEYRLPKTDYNKDGREKMLEYVKKNTPNLENAKTDKEVKQYKQLNLL